MTHVLAEQHVGELQTYGTRHTQWGRTMRSIGLW